VLIRVKNSIPIRVIRVHSWLKSHGLFLQFKAGLAKTQSKLVHESNASSRLAQLTGESIEELEAVLIAADLGMAMTEQIIRVKKNYETQGGGRTR